MSISAITNSIFNPYQPGATGDPYHKQIRQLSQDLQSGNLSAAQSDFAALKQAFSQPAGTTAPTSTNTSISPASNAIAQTFNQLAADLQSGNLSAAQKDFSTVQQDIQAQGGSGASHLRNRHHLGASGGPSVPSSLLQDLSQVGQSLPSGNLAAAQQSYSTLQQQLEQFAFGGGTLSTQAGALQD